MTLSTTGMILFVISFLAGVLTVLAPCTLPLLPVIVGSSVGGDSGVQKKKVFVIAGSLGISIIVFTLLLKVSTLFISVPQVFWTTFSGCIIILFGLVSIFPNLWDSLPFVNRLSIGGNKALSAGYRKQSIWGDVIIGASLGPVFSTCSPTYFVILATVLPQAFFLGLVDLLAYAVGLAGSLVVIAFLGQKIVGRLGGISENGGLFKQALGILFVILGFFVIFGVDKQIEAGLLNHGLFDITKVEQYLLRLNDEGITQTIATTTQQNSTDSGQSFSKKHGPVAPELVSPSGYINTGGESITIGQFRVKKVVLLDIWTYSCINCQRTLPYLKAWYEKYKDMGLVVIGLHTPEFAFEKVQSNVEDAVKRLGITYPVVLDNDYATWNAYGNQYWPRKYLISEDGEIIYDHIGEGNYEETEKAIQEALSELNGKTVSGEPTDITPVIPQAGSPETYFGSSRNEYLGTGIKGKSGEQYFEEPLSVSPNKLYLIGQWNIFPEYAQTSTAVGSGATGSDRIDYLYQAKSVYFVAGSSSAMDVEVLLDSKPVDAKIKGADIFYKNGRSYVKIQENRLYRIVEGSTPEKHLIEFIISNPGLRAYAFTFG